MSSPTISIVIPAYNSETSLPRALDSITSQTFENWEIVLVDDGSTDGTPDVAARYGRQLKDRFISVSQPNAGSSGARNAGIAACRGRFVAFLDSDDEFLPTKLERQLDLFQRRAELGFVYCDFAFVDLAGVRHESVFDAMLPQARQVPHERIAPGLCVCGAGLFDALIRSYFIPTIVGMVRREVLGTAIRFPDGHAYAEEWLFYLRVAKACRAGFVDEPLCLHHHTPDSLARSDKQRNTLRQFGLLQAIGSAFDDLTPRQRRSLRRNLAHTSRQLGYDTLRLGDKRAASAYFAKSFLYRPTLRVMGEMIKARLAWATPVRPEKVGGEHASQGVSQVVR